MHQPVLLKEVLEYLEPEPGKNFIDCTVGLGGHALPILEKIAPQGKLLGIDLDEKALEKFKFQVFHPTPFGKKGRGKFQENFILVQGNFKNLKKIVEKYKLSPIQGILFDLGMSSWQIEESGRGFSFLRDEPLDMRFYSENSKPCLAAGQQRIMSSELTAEIIINQWPEKELARIFREYGEERYARSIARQIVQRREIQPIKTTSRLVEIIRQAVPVKYRHGRIHFATRTFQALRLAVNDELNNLSQALPQALEILAPAGRIVVISFHSLEDRIVKNFFREEAKLNHLKILTKKPIRPDLAEIKTNPRSRSAKLRAAEKI